MSTTISALLPPATSEPAYPYPGIPDDPDAADRNCRLLGPFALFVQTVMGFVVLGTLVLKRQREKPKRPWKIWTLDISKQMLGQLFVHILNVVLSSLGSIASEGVNNPCSLYFLNIAIDTTVGVLFIYFSMRYLTHYFTDVLGWPGFVSGQYLTVPTVLGRRRRRRANEAASFDEPRSPISDTASSQHTQSMHATQSQPAASAPTNSTKKQKPRLSFFFRQLSLYLFSLLLMKVMVVILFALLPFLFDVGRWVLNLFGEHRKAQVFFVMAAFPLAMNTLQFWLIDSLLRHNPLTSVYRSAEDDDAAAVANGTNRPDSFDRFRDSRLSGTGSEDVEEGSVHRPSWRDRNQHRNEEDSQRHLVGEASDDDEEDHAYPPPRSTSSSVAQLEKLKRAATEGSPGRMGATEQTNGNADYGATLGSPPLEPQKGIQEGLGASHGRLSGEGDGNDEEEEVWDNWDEDQTARQAKKID